MGASVAVLALDFLALQPSPPRGILDSEQIAGAASPSQADGAVTDAVKTGQQLGVDLDGKNRLVGLLDLGNDGLARDISLLDILVHGLRQCCRSGYWSAVDGGQLRAQNLLGVGTRILSTLLRYMPKIGPFKGLGFDNPTPQTEDLYIKSINTTVDQYRAFLEQVRTDTLVLPNCDLDSGQATKAAEYSLTDDSYAKLLAQLSEHKFDRTSPELRDNILQFYSDLSASIETKKDQRNWQNILTELDQLKSMPPVTRAAR